MISKTVLLLYQATQSSGIESTKQIRVPGPWLVSVLLEIEKEVGSIVQHFGDDERAFPCGGELVRPLLIHSEHEVTFMEGSTPDVPCMKATQILPVLCRPYQSHLSLFFKVIHSVLTCLFSFSL